MHKLLAVPPAAYLATSAFLCLSLGLTSCGDSQAAANSAHPALQPATVYATANPLVAAYAVPATLPGEVSIEFGTDTS